MDVPRREGVSRPAKSSLTTRSAGSPTYNKLDLLKLMYLSREGDRREGILFRQGQGWFQIGSMGHEALGVIPTLLNTKDFIFPYYRDRAMVLARGVTNLDLAHAFFAKRESSSGGRQMPSHFCSRSHNIWSVPTPTGANLLPACGVAWGLQMDGLSNVVVACTGEAATRQGEFYEAVSFAIERKLPVVFVVQDNRYGISTNTDSFNPFKLGVFNPDLGIHQVNGRDVKQLRQVASDCVSKARMGGGPSVLVCELDRLCSHTSSDDHRVYRPPEEISEMMERDPIRILAEEMIDSGELTLDQWEVLQGEIDRKVDEDYQLAALSPDPDPQDLMAHLYGPETKAETPPIEGGRDWRMVDSVNSVFRGGLEKDERFLFFGEDVEDPKGGVFKLTAGLSTDFPSQVFNSPLAECSIAGIGVGLASYGKRPVFEMQFVDFVTPAWNQITTNMSTLRWRTDGQWQCPMVLYAPYGAYLPGGGPWHSQANESMFAHFPGLRVVVPSTPEDAAGLMWTAMHADDPTIYLIPKHLFRQNIKVDPDIPAVPFGRARIRQAGTDVTVVAWGNAIEVASQAAEQLEGEVSVELIDLRSLVPWDRDTVRHSVEKTGRLVVVQEDTQSCSIGQMIISELSHDAESWYHFASPPKLVSKPDIHIGYNPIFEYAALPSVADVMDNIRLTFEE